LANLYAGHRPDDASPATTSRIDPARPGVPAWGRNTESGRQSPARQQELLFVKTLIRRAVAEELPAIAVADGRGFGLHYSDQDIDDFRPLFEPERFLLARDANLFGQGAGTASRRVLRRRGHSDPA